MTEEERAKQKAEHMKRVTTWSREELESACADYMVDSDEFTKKYITAREFIRNIIAKSIDRVGSVIEAEAIIENLIKAKASLGRKGRSDFAIMLRQRFDLVDTTREAPVERPASIIAQLIKRVRGVRHNG